ncbi:MAG: hypothetical protein HWE23_10415 [Rhodobacteraceae bacterium]|nr:hypothetical protein [Paracoccaceae bacterium]
MSVSSGSAHIEPKRIAFQLLSFSRKVAFWATVFAVLYVLHFMAGLALN